MDNQLRQKINSKSKNFIILLLLVILIGLGAIIIFKRNGISIENYNSVIDSLHTERDNLGRQKASIKVLEFENEKAFNKLKTNDSTIKWLQEVVRDFKGQVKTAVVAALSTMDLGSSGTIILPGDAVLVKDTIRIYPKYKTKWVDKWSEGEILATKDSVYRNIKIKNDWELTIGKPKKGLKYLFKNTELDVSLLNNNPNTVTNELRSFTVKTKQKKLGLGFSSGVCITSELKPTYFVGLSVNYNIIELF